MTESEQSHSNRDVRPEESLLAEDDCSRDNDASHHAKRLRRYFLQIHLKTFLRRRHQLPSVPGFATRFSGTSLNGDCI